MLIADDDESDLYFSDVSPDGNVNHQKYWQLKANIRSVPLQVQNITVVCWMSATGHFIPPAFIFSRQRMKAELMDSAPTQSLYSS